MSVGKVRWRDVVCKRLVVYCFLAGFTVGRDRLPPTFFAEQIMAMPVQRVPGGAWSEAAFYAARDDAPPGERWELVDGEVLVTPSPHWMHQRIVTRLLVLLVRYVNDQSIGETFVSPLDVKLEQRSDVIRRLLLAVEVVSPSSARHDRVRKRPHYQRNRVPEYWIVDDTSATFERWTPDNDRPELLSERLVWQPVGAAQPFELDLVAFFGDSAIEG